MASVGHLTLLLFLLLLPILTKKQNKNIPPSPPKLPFIGNLHQLGSLFRQSFCQLSKRYGPVMLLHLGNVPVLVVSSAEAARVVLKIHDLNSCSRPPLVAAEATMGSFCAAEYFPYMGWIVDMLSGLNQRRERIFQELDNFFQRVIDDHLGPERTKQEQEDIIDVLLKTVKEQTGFGAALLTENNIKAVLLNMFLGGVDTGAITIVWAVAELAKRPELMKKAQAEVRTCIGNKGKVSESDTDQLQYLKMIVKETLRLHPSAPLLLPRETISHFKINGYEIFPKTLVQVNAWAIGRDPEYWKDPEEFIPERFLDSSIDFKGQHFELLPFGSGRRVCPAIYMGTTTVELALANLLYCFDWKMPNEMEEVDINMEEAAGLSLTLSKRTPLNLVPVVHHCTT
ncbi:Cytochrome P [Trema orientale]|uniref:Cytochrome P n=1 Tax=Trema orientale TaxID=63057 RepID=A0A2P5DMY1_TREOI|nr:Cytochrome P [Trema orientale]